MARQKCCCVYFTILCLALIALGTIMLVFAVSDSVYLKPSSQTQAFVRAVEANRSDLQSGLLLALCSASMLAGLGGLLGTFFRSGCMLSLVLALLTIDFICRCLLVVLVTSSCVSVHKRTDEAIRNQFNEYGSTASQRTTDFTDAVNNFANEELCCGWSENDKTNLYIGSAWHRFTKTSVGIDGGFQLQSVPSHCCRTGSSESCVEATDLVIARRTGVIYSKNCLVTLIKNFRFIMYIYIAYHSAILLLNITGIYSSALLVKELAEDIPSDSSSSSSSSSSDLDSPSQRQTDPQKQPLTRPPLYPAGPMRPDRLPPAARKDDRLPESDEMLAQQDTPPPMQQDDQSMVQQGNLPVQQGNPPGQQGNPPVQQGYPPVQQGYPPVQQGYPPVQQKYSPSQPPNYPSSAEPKSPPK